MALTVLVFVAFIVLGSCQSTVKHVHENVTDYQSSCVTWESGDIDCAVTVSGKWTFLAFRDWLEQIKENVGDVSLDLSCLEGGVVFLPYPFQARNIRKLHVKNCRIEGYVSEHNTTYKYPNTMKDLALIDVTILQDVITILNQYLNTQSTRSGTCGQENLIRSVNRNQSTVLINIMDIFNLSSEQQALAVQLMSGGHDALMEKHRTQNFTCIYENMIYMEDTFVNILPKHFFDFLTDHNRYPKLTVYNFTYSYIVSLPRQLKQWSKHFPALRKMDISNNALQSFSFEHPDLSQPSVYINLANNNISSVPEDLPSYLDGKTHLFINLLDNPIHCDCTAVPLLQYLKALLKKAPEYTNLTKVKCHSPTEYLGKEVLGVDLQPC